jgi:hypothetical protein
MRETRPRLWGTHLQRRRAELALLLAAATLLELGAGIGLAFVAGFGRVRDALGGFDGTWLIVLVGALSVSFVGYYNAYRGVFRVEGGPRLSWRHMSAVVAAGFGGFLAYAGGALDQYALQSAGADKSEARVRAAALSGMEHGVLAIGGCGTSIVVLVAGLSKPSPAYTLPWAIAPVPGFLIAFWLAERYRARFHGRTGWRSSVCTFLDSIHIVRALFVHPLRWAPALLGMALFWAAEAFAAWAGLAAFGFKMNAAALFVGFATGMVFTRRTGPLAGAGVLAVVLPLTIWLSGAPLPVAIVGVFTYRLAALWLPVPATLGVLKTLRNMGQLPEPEPEPAAAGPRDVPEPREAGGLDEVVGPPSLAGPASEPGVAPTP